MCWFSQLDQTAAYWQVKLEEEAQLKTAFLTEQGQYCYQTQAFGTCNGAATYQRLMTKVLKDLFHKSVVVYTQKNIEHEKRAKFCAKMNAFFAVA